MPSLTLIDLHPSNPKSGDLHVIRDTWNEADDEHDCCGGLSVTFDALTPHMLSPEPSESNSTATSVASNDDPMAQFIHIAWDSPWFCLPRTSNPISSSPPHGSHAFACSSDVRQAMAHQELLLDLFHEELRRIIPSDNDYDCAWVEDIDPDLVLSPVQSYEELCWRAATYELPMTILRQNKPDLPDVPVGCEDQLDDTF